LDEKLMSVKTLLQKNPLPTVQEKLSQFFVIDTEANANRYDFLKKVVKIRDIADSIPDNPQQREMKSGFGVFKFTDRLDGSLRRLKHFLNLAHGDETVMSEDHMDRIARRMVADNTAATVGEQGQNVSENYVRDVIFGGALA
jgi:hypothetical protein